jgi:hypothetical protein
MKPGVQPHEVRATPDVAIDDLDTIGITDHLDRECPDQRINPYKEPSSTETGLQFPA